jgi:adenylate cyclase
MEETAVQEPPAVQFFPPQKRKISWFSKYWLVMAVVVLGIVAAGIWKIFLGPAPMEVAFVDRMKFPLPDEPSIAVLPFVNMSEDPKQEFLCDGMAEAIITALSRVPRMFVISRNSTSIYKGKPVTVKQVSEELGVRYVLEGSVQRYGDRIRINAQLIDALKGNHLWAERYDRDVKDVFAVQDEITLKIVKATQVKLTEGEAAVLIYEWKGSQNLDCYLKAVEGIKYVERINIEDNNSARRLANEALASCPDNVVALLVLASTYRMDILFGTTRSPGESLQKALDLTKKAVTIDDNYAWGHAFLGVVYASKGEYDKAIAEGERAIALNPSGADIHVWMGSILTSSGKPEEAIPLLQKAIRLNPFGPTWYFVVQGIAYQLAGRFEEALSAFKKAVQRSPDNLLAHLWLASTYSMIGREKEARAEAAEVLRVNPKFSLDYFGKITFFFRDESVREKNISALRGAGLK